MVRVVLPAHLRTLARVGGDEVQVELIGQPTLGAVLDAIEASYPVLRGAIRDHVTEKRRPFVRFFACEQDLSHELPTTPLPDAVASGDEPFLVVGATAGGWRIGTPHSLIVNCKSSTRSLPQLLTRVSPLSAPASKQPLPPGRGTRPLRRFDVQLFSPRACERIELRPSRVLG